MNRGATRAKLNEPADVELKRLRRLETRVLEFEEASGIEIASKWTGKKVGMAVEFVIRGGIKEQRRALEELSDRAREVIAICEAAIAQSE